MKRALLAMLLGACGAGSSGNPSTTDGGDGDASAHDGAPADGTEDGGTSDGATSDGANTDAGMDSGVVTPIPLAPCATAPATWGPLPTGVTWPQVYDPGPLMTHGARAFVFLEGSQLWTIAHAGSASTAAKPSARAAPDGHVWVRTAGAFHEQTGATFANRGGGPAGPLYWDVDGAGAVIILAYGDTQQAEKLAVWRLAAGAGGWTKVGALHAADVAPVSIEGGFALGSFGPGTIARDGSIHVFSDARCIGTGQRNKTQLYARSRDGVTWSVEALPSADALHAGNVTWSHNAFWASDYDNARLVITSSPAPTFDGWEYHYPDRRYDLVGRCLDAQGNATFGRLASTRNPGWTTRGYASISATGATAFLTSDGLVQVAN